MGFYSDLMGFYSDLLGFYCDLMGYEWDVPVGRWFPTFQHGGFLNWGYPQIIHFNKNFFYKPSIFWYLNFRNPPYIVICNLIFLQCFRVTNMYQLVQDFFHPQYN